MGPDTASGEFSVIITWERLAESPFTDYLYIMSVYKGLGIVPLNEKNCPTWKIQVKMHMLREGLMSFHGLLNVHGLIFHLLSIK